MIQQNRSNVGEEGTYVAGAEHWLLIAAALVVVLQDD